jgi:hypothetical protein
MNLTNKILFKHWTTSIMKYIAFQHLVASQYTLIMYQDNKTFNMQHNVITEIK